jgi:hypothetical protein
MAEIWAEIDPQTGKVIRPEGLGLIGQSFTYKGQVYTVTNTDCLFPTERVICETSTGERRSMTAAVVAGLLRVTDG